MNDGYAKWNAKWNDKCLIILPWIPQTADYTPIVICQTEDMTWVSRYLRIAYAHRQRGCLLLTTFRLKAKKHQMTVLLTLFAENTPVTSGFPSQKGHQCVPGELWSVVWYSVIYTTWNDRLTTCMPLNRLTLSTILLKHHDLIETSYRSLCHHMVARCQLPLFMSQLATLV